MEGVAQKFQTANIGLWHLGDKKNDIEKIKFCPPKDHCIESNGSYQDKNSDEILFWQTLYIHTYFCSSSRDQGTKCNLR